MACGTEQVYGIDYKFAFAAVMDMSTFKVLLALAASLASNGQPCWLSARSILRVSPACCSSMQASSDACTPYHVMCCAGNNLPAMLDTIMSSSAGLASIASVKLQHSPSIAAKLTGVARRLAVLNAKDTAALYAEVSHPDHLCESLCICLSGGWTATCMLCRP